MRRVSTRELLHNSTRIQAGLARGESFEWTRRGKVIGIIQPARAELPKRAEHGWVERAREAGAVIPSGQTVSKALYGDRD
jgi:hypothetical protein